MNDAVQVFMLSLYVCCVKQARNFGRNWPRSF